MQASEYVCPRVYLFVRVSTCAYFQVCDHECLWVYVLIYESVCMLCVLCVCACCACCACVHVVCVVRVCMLRVCVLCVCCFDQSHSAKADK